MTNLKAFFFHLPASLCVKHHGQVLLWKYNDYSVSLIHNLADLSYLQHHSLFSFVYMSGVNMTHRVVAICSAFLMFVRANEAWEFSELTSYVFRPSECCAAAIWSIY